MKMAIFFFSGFLAAAAFAGADNLVVTFSTQGPDKYADGTTVLDGECYALIYTPDGAEFGGIAGDGTAIKPSKVVIAAPIAKNGGCPQVQFQIDEGYRAANYPSGTWGVYLLDTRRFETDKDGVINTNNIESVGDSKQVNGYGKVATLGAGNFTSAAAGFGEIDKSAKLGEGDKVKVKGIKVVGDYVHITAEAPAYSRIGLQAGDKPAEMKSISGEKYGSDSEDVIFISHKTKGPFFKVQVK